MTRKWTDEEVQAEIQAAVKIVNEDREKREYARLHETYGDKSSSDNGDSGSGDGQKAPPRKEGDPEPPVDNSGKRSLWWGDAKLDDA